MTVEDSLDQSNPDPKPKPTVWTDHASEVARIIALMSRSTKREMDEEE